MIKFFLKIIKLYFLISILLIVGLLIYTLFYSKLKIIFNNERKKEVVKYIDKIEEKNYNKEDLKIFPEVLQKYLINYGILNINKIVNADIVWKNSFIKLQNKSEFIKLKTEQFNSVITPFRTVYMRAFLFGYIPFEGRDKFADNKGSMIGKLVNLVDIFNTEDEEITVSALLTILAESLIVPGYLFQDYISFENIDEKSFKAIIKYNDIEVSGNFYFNEKYEFIKFETRKRYYMDKNGYKNYPWIVNISDYKEMNNIKFPSKMSAKWLIDKQDYVYYKGEIEMINFNVKK
jgi:flagellar biosynthesis regulator FlbT